jgi:hypothetical protein
VVPEEGMKREKVNRSREKRSISNCQSVFRRPIASTKSC